MRGTKGINRTAAGTIFSAGLALSFLAATGPVDAASLDTHDGGTAAHGTITRPPAAPTTLIKIVLQPLGISWED